MANPENLRLYVETA